MISTLPTPSPRDVWWAHVDGANKSVARISVITRVEHDFVELVYGQSIGCCAKDVVVTQNSATGKRFGLTKDTFFRCTNVLLVLRGNLKSKICACPMMLFPSFESLAVECRKRGHEPSAGAAPT